MPGCLLSCFSFLPQFELTCASFSQVRADFYIRDQNWQRCISNEGNFQCSNLRHPHYEVLPIQRNGHCLFICFVEILRERNVSGAPVTQQAMRCAIADYFDNHGGAVTYREVRYPPDEAIRTNGYGGLTEIIAFVTMYNISVEVHAPETNYVQRFGSPGAVPELLLQTLGWDDDGRRAIAGDHWQRLRKKGAA